MKTFNKIAISIMTTSALLTAGSLTYSWYTQTHKEDTPVITVATPTSTTEETTSTSTTEETTSTTQDTETETQAIEYISLQIFDREHCQNPSPQMADGVYYSIDSVNHTMTAVTSGFYVLASPANCPEYIEVLELKNGVAVDSVKVTGDGNYNLDPTLNTPTDNAEVFCKWLRQIAPSGTTQNGLQSNYNYWIENVK